MPGRRRFREWTAGLDRIAARLNLSPQLKGITLAHMLSGDTCTPIGLPDFEAYLTYAEYSLENLHFVVWYQDYRRRFFSLPTSVQQQSPGSTSAHFPFSQPSHARKECSIRQSERRATLGGRSTTSRMPAIYGSYTSEIFKPDVSGAELVLAVPQRSASQFSFSVPLSKEHALSEERGPVIDTKLQPFRDEISQGISTFFRPGSEKELSLDSRVRDAVISDLTFNTHPDVLLPIYEDIYNTLESVSLPRFLAHATANINHPLQLLWYFVGLGGFLLGLAIAIPLIVYVPISAQANRAWRLFSVPFASLGAMTMYSAWRGFCSRVWRRGNMQVRPWELDSAAGDDLERGLVGNSYAEKHTTAVIAPFALNEMEDGRRGEDAEGGRRVPLFGPERVVLDPRIAEVHRKVMRDIYACGVWFSLGYCAIILSVPSAR